MIFKKKREVKLQVEQMHCGHCAGRVKDTLKALGCTATVSLDTGVVLVKCPDDVSDQTLTEALTAAGYPAKLL